MQAACYPASSSMSYDGSDDESDAYSIVSDSYAPSHGTAATSVDWDMRSVSRAPSVLSMTSSIRSAAFRHEYGRGINNYSEVYRLPADDEELDRLDKQHLMFIEVMGKYPPPLAEVLVSDVPGETKTVVDLGCGSGSWISDVARDFPDCFAVAVDLVPIQAEALPPNCRSEVDDVNLGLQHFYGDFDVAHARLISSGIRDYAGLVDHIALTLRPGGLIDLTEFDFRVYGVDKRPIPINEQASALARWMHLMHQAVHYQGGEPDAANHIYRYVNQHDAFEGAVYRHWWFQTSTWNKGQDSRSRQLNRWGAAMRDDILAFLRSGRPLLLGTGVPQDVVDDIEERARCELLDGRVPGYILVESVYARKKR